MVVEIHTAGKPAVPGRALLVSLTLLLLACAVAAGMVWLRSGEPLGERIKPPGWEISFRPPRRFQPYTPQGWANPEIRRFVGVTQQGAGAVLAIGRIDEVSDVEAWVVAIGILELGGLRASETARSEEVFGPSEGAEIRGPNGATIVRAAIVERDVAFFASLNVQGGLIDDHLYRLFDLTCRSIELTGR